MKSEFYAAFNAKTSLSGYSLFSFLTEHGSAHAVEARRGKIL